MPIIPSADAAAPRTEMQETLGRHQELLSRLPETLSTLLDSVCCIRKETHHVINEQSYRIERTLDPSPTSPQGSYSGDQVPLPNDLFFSLRSAIGYDEEGLLLINEVDHCALGKALSRIILDKRVFAELEGVLKETIQPSLGDLAKTDGGAKAICTLIHNDILTGEDKADLDTILIDLATTNWGGYSIEEMVTKEILIKDDEGSLRNLLPQLSKTPGGRVAMSTMVQKGILVQEEINKSTLKEKYG